MVCVILKCNIKYIYNFLNYFLFRLKIKMAINLEKNYRKPYSKQTSRIQTFFNFSQIIILLIFCLFYIKTAKFVSIIGDSFNDNEDCIKFLTYFKRYFEFACSLLDINHRVPCLYISFVNSFKIVCYCFKLITNNSNFLS